MDGAEADEADGAGYEVFGDGLGVKFGGFGEELLKTGRNSC